MAVVTSQKITTYYDRFKTIEVTFTKEIILVTGLIPQQVYIKCIGDFWPCVIYSSSFEGAKIACNIKSGILQRLAQSGNMVSLRYCFKNGDSPNPVAFFVSAKAAGYTPYGGSKDVALFNLQFTQRPPDDLIEIMGKLLDANVNSAKRRDDRILITPESTRKLQIVSKESAVFIEGVPRRCIIRDISFSGAKVIMMGVAKFLENREAALRLDFDEPRESFLLRGKFVRTEAVEGRKDLVALGISFEEGVVPMGYKIRLNEYLGQVRGDARPEEFAPPLVKPAAVEPAAPQPTAAEQTEPSLHEAAPMELDISIDEHTA